MKTTFIKHIIIFTIISFSFAIELSTQKLEMSFDSPYNQNLTVKELLDFAKEHNSKAPIVITKAINNEKITPPCHITNNKQGIPNTFTNVRDLFLF